MAEPGRALEKGCWTGKFRIMSFSNASYSLRRLAKRGCEGSSTNVRLELSIFGLIEGVELRLSDGVESGLGERLGLFRVGYCEEVELELEFRAGEVRLREELYLG